MPRNKRTSLPVATPKNVTPGAIPTTLGTSAMSAIDDVEPSVPEVAGLAKPPTSKTADDSKSSVVTNEDVKPKNDSGIPEKPANQTTHIMVLTYKGTDKPKRKPRKLEPTPEGLLDFPELAGAVKKSGPLKQYQICPVAAAKKDADTEKGIAGGKYYSMVHQFPDIIESHGRGPTNLDRKTYIMNFPSTRFVPLTPRGHERIAAYEREQEEKAIREAYEGRFSVRWRKGFKSFADRLMPKTTFKPGQEYSRDKGPPVFPEDKARARKEAAEAAREVQEAEETPSIHSEEELSRPLSLNGSEDNDGEAELYPPTDGQARQETDSLATRSDRLSTDDSANAGYPEQPNSHRKTFKVPTRTQNGFLNTKGKQVAAEEN